ncbi:MAG: DUF1559 domain-containing protein, partial [Planctomycetota bacterium]
TPAETAEAAEAEEAAAWGMAPMGVAPAELLWRKWLLWATMPAAGLVIAVTAWSLLPSSTQPEAPPLPVVEVSDEPVSVVKEPEPVDESTEPIAVRLDRRWVPNTTRLLVSLRTSRLAGREEFDLAVPLVEPVWQAVVGKLAVAFGLKIETIRRLTWASTDLATWPDCGVVVVKLEDGQDAGVFRLVGEEADFRLDGAACRRLSKGDWPHPFAILDESTIVTGREELLRHLADRSEPALESGALDRLFQVTTPDADVTMLLDLRAAREANWRLPTSLLDVWPAGRDAWRVVWEMPQGVGLSLDRGEEVVGEVALVCESETAAETLRGALDELMPAAETAIETHLESLDGKVEAGRLRAADADQYERFLTQGAAALEIAHWEVAEEMVWLRTGWGKDVSALVAAALDSRPAIRAEWLSAARIADEANHGRLLSGLKGYEQAEGHFPIGAGGGSLLAPETRLSWIAAMLPYYGHRDWLGELEFGYSWNSPQNRPVSRRQLDLVINPALGPGSTEAGFPVTHYVGVAGVGPDAGTLKPGHPRAGVFGFSRTTRTQDIPDGASNTIALLGVSGNIGAWAAGGAATVRGLTGPPYVNGPDGFGSGQPNGMLAGMADGSVRFLSKDIDPRVLEQLVTTNGGESVTVAALEPAGAAQPVAEPEEPSGEDKSDDSTEKPEPPMAADAPEPAVIAEEPQVEVAVEPVEVDVEGRLADPILKIGFLGVPLVEAIELLSQVSTLGITFDLEAMAELGVSVRDPVTVEVSDATVGDVLEAVLAARGLVYVVVDGQILVTSPESRRNSLRTVTYRVSDLTGPDPAALAALAESVEKLVAPDTWQRGGGRGTIEAAEGVLTAAQTEAVHYRILAFCEKLRSARGIPLRSRHDPEKFTLATRSDRARAKLSRPITANFHEPAPLARIAADLEALSGAGILVDWAALASQGLSPEARGSLSADGQPLSEALDLLLEPMDLAYRVVDADTIEITTRKVLADRLELEFHPLADLLTGERTASSLMDRIKDEVAGATWSEANGPGLMHLDEPSGCLIVLQSQPVQLALEALLDRCRAEKATENKQGNR